MVKQMPYTNDPIADYHRYDDEQQKKLERLPECAECGHPITDEDCFEINDELICEECLDNNHRKKTEDFIE